MGSVPNKKGFEVAIIGGGIAGATLAIAFLSHNIPFTLYEQGHGFSEIGAGVALSPNAVRAMQVGCPLRPFPLAPFLDNKPLTAGRAAQICDESVYEAFQRVSTPNGWELKKHVYFDVRDGRAGANPTSSPLFQLTNEQGQNAVHRADFMDELAKLIPPGRAKFRKHLDTIDEDAETGKLHLRFHDGSVAEADAVVGCDGIKSRTRAIVVGEDHPSAKATYTHKFAYRGVIPTERVVEALGQEIGMNSSIWLGHDAHVLSYPINGGKTINLFAAVTDPNPWPSDTKLTLPAKKEDALRDFAGFGPEVLKSLEMVEESLDRWALFDTAAHPLPFFNRGRILVLGDAAHATTPHHGAGAGFCVEDSAVLVRLLADARVQGPQHLEAVFAAFDANRRPRSQWLVATSRRTGDLYELRDEGYGDSLPDVERVMKERYNQVWHFDIAAAADEARRDLGTRLDQAGEHVNAYAHKI